jgi:hypothetical protein
MKISNRDLAGSRPSLKMFQKLGMLNNKYYNLPVQVKTFPVRQAHFFLFCTVPPGMAL